jgi:hypothetical protein
MPQFIGKAGDFAFLEGASRVRHRRLRRRLAGCADWDDEEGGYRGFQLADAWRRGAGRSGGSAAATASSGRQSMAGSTAASANSKARTSTMASG